MDDLEQAYKDNYNSIKERLAQPMYYLKRDNFAWSITNV
ncbi:hypothetical protein CKL83_15680 [Bacillus anthracis]|uniref:Uncharacterized protein n=2 Tax=Bacillus anthracis TaxID=1392 RepID=A0A0F7RHX7_BACAN|nr:hypothetical protein BA_2770 [Bacillus anthracis str. Ames]AAT31885.1 hypothetical protein GBAA_2770 [Bacillus anthracis str. 'Ames Ancestor']ACP12470.1 hypothetical protein BAMEG_1826 [Bacillus anthracis str. CDC 684]AFH84026.1 Hypothetical Protein H9401_2640 [Bacillus anthracis str. H9401]AHK38811.1 hypothetical protein BAPAT_2661 [Bacillus anthracis str. SVA11]AIK32716.1 hypothetical protein DJ48_1525 [Bacillus anthracis]AIK66159.1 hypothetical protein DJ46_1547 [Bacillus anthracis str.